LKINIIYYDNGVGLTTEAKILQKELEGHEIVLFNSIWLEPIPKADVNIFLQGFDFGVYRFLDSAPRNILVPNQEWLNTFEVELSSKCDQIWCKTKLAYDLLKVRNKNCIVTGFTSFDMEDQSIKKQSKFIHFKGLSAQKNTELVIRTFLKKPYPLTIVDSNNMTRVFAPNIKVYRKYISNKEKIYEMNSNAFHLCPSLMEGWGHYVFEALSTGATLILPDAPIFNEITNKDIAVFLPTEKRIDNSLLFSSQKSKETYPLRDSYFVNEKSFEVICDILSNFEPKKNHLARQYFLENDFWFKKRIQEAIKNIY